MTSGYRPTVRHTFGGWSSHSVMDTVYFDRKKQGISVNLLTFSKIKDLDPERLNAGITNYPAYMTVTGGLSVSFYT